MPPVHKATPLPGMHEMHCDSDDALAGLKGVLVGHTVQLLEPANE